MFQTLSYAYHHILCPQNHLIYSKIKTYRLQETQSVGQERRLRVQKGQAQWLEFITCDPQGLKRERMPGHCPLTFTHMHHGMHTYIYVYI